MRMNRTLALLIAAAALCASPAWAGKPEWAGGPHGKEGKQASDKRGEGGNKHESKRGDEGNRGGPPPAVGAYFGEHQRVAVRSYYEQRGGKGCPPGLAKKHNGCLPPGQARKWAVGQPLPTNVIYYPVPTAVVTQIGVPPAGYRYVRVASDILLIAVGSRMVVDGMQDLVR
jgi:Ni/Co efflux regulator RcnB